MEKKDNTEAENLTNSIVVKQLSLSWLFKDGQNFMGLVEILNDSDNHTIFATNFVDILLKQFWGQYQKKLIYRMFLPFVAYFISQITTMAIMLDKKLNPLTNYEQIHVYIFSSMTLALWCYQVYLEYVQMSSGKTPCRNCKEKIKNYLT